MKKTLFTLLLLALLPVAAIAQYRNFTVTIYDQAGNIFTDACDVTVYDPGTSNAATIYVDAAGSTAKTNPIVDLTDLADGTIVFYGDYPYYDIQVTSDVYTAVIKKSSVKPTDNRIIYPLAEAVGNVSAGTLSTTGNVSFGVDGTGVDINIPGDTSGVRAYFDMSNDAVDFIGYDVNLNDDAYLRFGSDDDWEISCGTTKILQLTPLSGDESYSIYVGADTAGADLKVFGGDTGEYVHYDSSAGSLLLYSTSTSTAPSTSIEPIYSYMEMTGAAGVGGRANFHMYTNVELGSWANALKGYTEFGSAGSVTGLGSAIVAEMKLPGAALTRGSYAVSEIELVTTASGTTGGNPVAMIWMQVSGDQTATDDWEDNGYIWIIKGLTDNAGNIFDTNTTPTCDATLRILVGSTPYYILLSSSPTS